jgi:hypothetical protein
VCRIEIFGGYLPVVTIDRDKSKSAGNCKTNLSHVANPVAYLYFSEKSKLNILKA